MSVSAAATVTPIAGADAAPVPLAWFDGELVPLDGLQAGLAVAALGRPETIRRSLPVVGPRAWSTGEITQLCEKYSGKSARVFRVRPFLLRLQGTTAIAPQSVAASAGFDWAKADSRREFLRVRWGADGRLERYANQSSGVLTSTVWGDGVVDNPAGSTIRAGDTVRFIPWAELL